MRIMFLDIEVLQEEHKFPHPSEADRPIILYTIYDNYMQKFFTVIQRDDLKPHIEQKEPDWHVVYLNNEKDLMLFFLKLFKALDPDIITGWNVFFDLAYLIHRAEVMNYFDPKELSRLDRTEIDWENDDIIIAGRHVFDMLKAYRKIKRQPSYSLKYIAKVEGVTEKTEEAEDVPYLYKHDLNRLIVYNKTDVQILLELEKKLGIIQQFLDMRNYVGVNDINDPFMFSVLLDTLALRIAKELNVVLPSKNPTKHKSYEGAIVFDPVGGIHHNVIVLDMNRYYPSIILSLNLSPETIEKDTDELGLLPRMVLYLFRQREKYERLMEQFDPASEEYQNYARKRQVVKDLVNAVYGWVGYSKSRLFRVELASKITEVARKGLLFIRNVIEKEVGYKVIYGDTDSIFVKIGGDEEKPVDELIELGKKLEDYINKRLEDFAYKDLKVKRNYLSVGFEKVYSPILFIKGVKKRYAARVRYEKGKVTDYVLIKGFDTIRTDSPEVLREVQGKILEMILYGKSKDEIVSYLRQIYKNIKQGKYSPYELGIPKGIQKPLEAYKNPIPFHIRAAIWSNKYLGTKFGDGDKIKVLYVKRVKGYPPTDVIAFTDDMKLPEVVIDKDKYIEWLRSKTEDIIQSVGIHWKEIMGEKNLWNFLGGGDKNGKGNVS